MARVSESAHLADLVSKKSGSVETQVVFLDVVSYSKRKSATQKLVVEKLQNDIQQSIVELGRASLEYIQANGINFSTDVVVIPTGDGAAVAFTFTGMSNLALDFARLFLKLVHNNNTSIECGKFSINRWCNCHPLYQVRIGINEGKAILFQDVNGQVNLAGTCLNDANRIMSAADGSQILLSDAAYSNVLDMTSDMTLEHKIVDRGTLRLKHDKEIRVHQYIGEDEPYVDADVPIMIKIQMQQEANLAKLKMGEIGSLGMDKEKLLELSVVMGGVLDGLGNLFPGMKNPDIIKLGKK